MIYSKRVLCILTFCHGTFSRRPILECKIIPLITTSTRQLPRARRESCCPLRNRKQPIWRQEQEVGPYRHHFRPHFRNQCCRHHCNISVATSIRQYIPPFRSSWLTTRSGARTRLTHKCKEPIHLHLRGIPFQ